MNNELFLWVSILTIIQNSKRPYLREIFNKLFSIFVLRIIQINSMISTILISQLSASESLGPFDCCKTLGSEGICSLSPELLETTTSILASTKSSQFMSKFCSYNLRTASLRPTCLISSLHLPKWTEMASNYNFSSHNEALNY